MASEQRVLRAGVARAIITPPLGIRMCGYAVQDCFAADTHGQLTATVLVLTPGDADTESAVLVACDLVCLSDKNNDAIRDQIAGRLGISPDGILINCSHTHLGPTLPNYQPRGSIDSAEFAEECAAAAGPISFSRSRSAATGGYPNEAHWRMMCCQEHLQGRYLGPVHATLCCWCAGAMHRLVCQVKYRPVCGAQESWAMPSPAPQHKPSTVASPPASAPPGVRPPSASTAAPETSSTP